MPGCVGSPERTDVLIKAALHVAGRELPVTIIDMTEADCKIRCLHILPIGEVEQLVIPAFQSNTASVRWSLPGVSALRFV
jgi:hypothetical protein